MIVRRDFGALAPPKFFDGAVRRILDLQRPDGSIPWYDGGVIDAWNHTHAAMGLSVAGCLNEAERAHCLGESAKMRGPPRKRRCEQSGPRRSPPFRVSIAIVRQAAKDGRRPARRP